MCNFCECNSFGCKKYLDYKNRCWYLKQAYCSRECIKKNIHPEFDKPFCEKKVVSDSDMDFKCTNDSYKKL